MSVPQSQDDLASLQRQLNEARTNLRLIEDRKAEYVLGVEVPLQLIKEERRLRDHIAELEAKLGLSPQPPASPVSTETRPSSARPAINLGAGIVAICAANGDIGGTGFVVAERLILTCAHVVEAASGGPGGSIGVRYHLNGVTQTAQVVAQWWSDPKAEDIAVLQVAENLPSGVQPLKLGKSIGCETHAFRSLGYPNVGDYVGIAASGVIESSTQKADGQRMLQLTSAQLAQGHSGAPVWDEVQQAVVGMVSEVYHAGKDNKNRDTAFATPSETLQQLCVELPLTNGSLRMKPDNPFYTKGRINDPALFFDREQIIREVQTELKKHCSVSLVGESQIGKSSLLHYLYTTRTTWLPQATVVFVDLQLVVNEADFCQRVLKNLGESGNTLIDLRNALETRDVVLLLDEVEKLSNRAFTSDLHDLLRALGQQPNFAMGVATQRPLTDVFPPDNLTSPFHNIFGTVKTLGPFTPDEARRFLTTTLAPTGVTFSPRDVDRLLRDSGGHPARLQRLAKTLFDELVNG